ncbi:MAG: class I SAM-dependent methyltransferase [Thermoplasmatota archaeon]
MNRNPSTVELDEDMIGNIPKGSKVLEFACARGRTAFRLEEMGYRVTAFDIDPEVIDACRERNTTVEFLVADARDLPFPSGSFDACIMNAFMTMMDSPSSRSRAFNEGKRVLKKGGLLYLADFLLERNDPDYRKRYEAHQPITGEYGTFIV